MMFRKSVLMMMLCIVVAILVAIHGEASKLRALQTATEAPTLAEGKSKDKDGEGKDAGKKGKDGEDDGKKGKDDEDDDDNDEAQDAENGGVNVAGAVIGSLVGVGAAGAGFLYYRKRKQQKEMEALANQGGYQ